MNLKQFFRMTTGFILMVVVDSTHHHRAARIIGKRDPAREQPRGEMALIGPIVKNDVFFFVTILALAAAMVLLEWRGRRAPKADGLQGAALQGKGPLTGAPREDSG